MVESIDRLTKLVTNKAGLTEAILLPYFTIIDLVRISCVNKNWRNFFEPSHPAHHINFIKVFIERLQIPANDDEYDEAKSELQSVKSWK